VRFVNYLEKIQDSNLSRRCPTKLDIDAFAAFIFNLLLQAMSDLTPSWKIESVCPPPLGKGSASSLILQFYF